MKKSLLISSMFVAAAFVSQSALAEVKIRAGVGSSTYELSGDYITAKSTYSPVNVGVTFAADSGLYVDLAVSSGSGKHDGWGFGGYPSEEFKREDYALIVGGSRLNPDNGIATTFYGGLKGGKTTLGAQNVPFVPWYTETFETTGFVFGGGASFPIAQGRAGAVGVNLGVGLMSATWKDDRAVGTFNVKSKTAFGGSFGASYTFPFTPSFGVVADYKYNSYSYNFSDASTPFTVKENISTLGASLYVKF